MAVLGLSMAIFSQKLIDDFLPNNDKEKILIGFIALLVILLARSVLGLIRGIFMARQGKDLNIRIIRSFLEKIMKLPMAYFKGTSTGDLKHIVAVHANSVFGIKTGYLCSSWVEIIYAPIFIKGEKAIRNPV